MQNGQGKGRAAQRVRSDITFATSTISTGRAGCGTDRGTGAPARLAAVLLLAISSGAWAQSPAVTSLDKVVVTGSSVKRIDVETALPVQIWRREDIERSGAASTVELLQKLPTMQGSTAESVSVGAGGSGFAGVSLHGLGETRTLVLLNGRRIASFGGQALTGRQAGIDLNTIPLAAIERIEILSDGASALYGADAVGGVVNFILRRNFSGGEITGNASVTEGGGGNDRNASLTKGFGDLDQDGYNILFGAAIDRRSGLRATDRSFANAIQFFESNGNNYRFSRGSTLAIPANLIIGGVPTSAYLAANGSCPAYHIAVGPMCVYNQISAMEIMPQVARESFNLSFNRKLGDDHKFFADFLMSRSTTTSRVAATPGPFLLQPTSVFYPIAAGIGAVGPTLALWRAADLGQRVTEDRTEVTHFTTGFEGVAFGWDYSASLTRSISTYGQSLRDGWAGANAINAALNSGLVNPFVGPGQQSAAGQAALDGAKYYGYFDGGRTTFDFAELRGSREIGRLPEGPLLLGAGASWLKDNYKTLPSALALGVGDTRFGDATTVPAYTAKRTAWGTFAELVAPVAKGLEVTGGLRHDSYSDFGETTNYKMAARWQPARSFMLRGSAGTGFRAPTIPQIAAGRQNFGATGGSYACPFTPGQLPAGVECPAGVTQYTVFAEGNPNLKPETSRQWTLGGRWEPNETWTIGLDWWSVNLKDTIGQIDETVAFADPLTYQSLFTSYFDPVTNKTLLAFNKGNVNLGKTTWQGIDIDARLRLRTSLGNWSSHLLATYLMEHGYQRVVGGATFSDLGNYNDGGVAFRWQGRLINTLQMGALTHAATFNFKSGYTENITALNLGTGVNENVRRRVRAYLTWDWQSTWKATRATELAVGVINLFDQDPPLTLKGTGQQVGYDERYTDPRGRTLYARFKVRF